MKVRRLRAHGGNQPPRHQDTEKSSEKSLCLSGSVANLAGRTSFCHGQSGVGLFASGGANPGVGSSIHFQLLSSPAAHPAVRSQVRVPAAPREINRQQIIVHDQALRACVQSKLSIDRPCGRVRLRALVDWTLQRERHERTTEHGPQCAAADYGRVLFTKSTVEGFSHRAR